MSEEIINLNIMDTETTGFKPPPNGDIVEIAVTPMKVIFEASTLQDIIIGSTIERLANPGHKIHLEAMAVHHITEDMVKQEQSASEVKAKFADMKCDYWVAHNASFDARFFTPKFGRWICTMKAAQIIFPDAPSYKNQVLRYWLNLDKGMNKDRGGETHRAGFDTYVTAMLMAKLIMANKMSLKDMADLQSNPILQGKIPFGKHKGMYWKEVPKSYLSWLHQNTIDANIRKTCAYYLR